MESAEPIELDAAALKALSHPLRVQLWELLYEHGPATATKLAAETGQNTGVTSYHLRQLAQHGLIEETAGYSTGRGKGRERWWRAAPAGFSLRPDAFAADADSARAADLLVDDLVQRSMAELVGFQRRAPRMPEAWLDASVNSSYTMDLTSEELAEFTAEVRRVIERYAGRRAQPSSARVAVQFHAFPLRLGDDGADEGAEQPED
jgi:DNA-binding transcriptional ArsR family regulator